MRASMRAAASLLVGLALVCTGQGTASSSFPEKGAYVRVAVNQRSGERCDVASGWAGTSIRAFVASPAALQGVAGVGGTSVSSLRRILLAPCSVGSHGQELKAGGGHTRGRCVGIPSISRVFKARMAMARGTGEGASSESPPAREWSQVVSFSPEFCSLCQAQFEVLVAMLGARRCALYFRRENPLTGSLEFVPAAVYPERQRVWVVGEGPEGRPSSGPLELPGFISAENLMPNYPFNSRSEDGSPSALDISEGGISVPVQYGNVVIGMLAVWRSPKPDKKEVWSAQERTQVSKIAGSLALAVVLDQRNQFSYQEALHAESLRSMLSETLHQVKNSLSAVRLFGKLLLRRLPGDDLMNRELAKDILIQSDRMVELLVPYDGEKQKQLPLAKKPLMLGEAAGDGRSRSRSSSSGKKQRLIEPLTVSVTLGPEGFFPDIAQLHATDSSTGGAGVGAGAVAGGEGGIEEQLLYERLDKEFVELRQAARKGEVCQVEEALSPVISACQAIAEFDGVNLIVEVGKGLAGVTGDPRVLQEAMSNVMDNALKYCQLGGGPASVRLSVEQMSPERVQDGHGSGGVEIVVEDSGPGVDAEEIPLLCSRGFRGKASLESDVPGTGLGLHIVRELVFVMGGDLEFENIKEGGLRVRVSLYSPE